VKQYSTRDAVSAGVQGITVGDTFETQSQNGPEYHEDKLQQEVESPKQGYLQ